MPAAAASAAFGENQPNATDAAPHAPAAVHVAFAPVVFPKTYWMYPHAARPVQPFCAHGGVGRGSGVRRHREPHRPRLRRYHRGPHYSR